MPRRPRHEAAGAVHHVIFQGNGRCRIVRDRVDAERLWQGFATNCRTFTWECTAACLLGTHFHALLRTTEPNLGLGMQKLLGAHGRWFNLRHGREGHLFRSPFWSKRVTTYPQLMAGASYIALNPVRAGLCAHPAEWRWSTHRELAGLEPQQLVRAEGLLRALGNDDVERGRSVYRQLIEDDLTRLRETPAYRHASLGFLARDRPAGREERVRATSG